MSFIEESVTIILDMYKLFLDDIGFRIVELFDSLVFVKVAAAIAGVEISKKMYEVRRKNLKKN